jgi:hypothetical protein
MIDYSTITDDDAGWVIRTDLPTGRGHESCGVLLGHHRVCGAITDIRAS